MNLVAWGRLLRLSLLPTALADIAAGAVWAQGVYLTSGLEIFALMLASLCVYHGGMVLNDWSDRREDSARRPDRPLPSGAVRAQSALIVGALFFALAPLIAFCVDPWCGAAILAVTVCALVYDLVGRGPWLGPLLLGVCRAGNLGAGVLLGVRFGMGTSGHLEAAFASLPLAYGAYVFCVSRVGRLEDSDEPLGRRPLPWVALAIAVLLAAAFVPTAGDPVRLSATDFVIEVWQWRAGATLLAACAAYSPVRLAARTVEWTRPLAMRMTGMLLRRLLIFTAAAVIARGTWECLFVGAAILCGYPIAFALRKVFPPS